MSSNFIARTLTAGVIAALVVGAALAGIVTAATLVIIITAACSIEFIRITVPDTNALVQAGFAGLTILPIALTSYFYFDGQTMTESVKNALPYISVIFLLNFAFSLVFSAQRSFQFLGPLAIALLLFTIGGMLGMTVIGFSPLMLLAIFIILWSNDVFAYLVGSRFGKHKLAPNVSPGKTWEGMIGGAVFCVLAGYCMSFWITEISVQEWIELSLIISITGTFGDLLQSIFKRHYNIKDSGTFLPGHGGFWDRFDSFFGCIPFVAIYLM